MCDLLWAFVLPMSLIVGSMSAVPMAWWDGEI